MRKQLFSIGLRSGLAMILLICLQQAATAADDVTTVKIVRDASGNFVFDNPDVKIVAGQSITWVALDAQVPHRLVADPANPTAFKDTGEFNSSNPPTQKFDSPGVIKYFCLIHPATMRGTITVTAAESGPPAKSESTKKSATPKKKAKPHKARPPHRSYSYY